MPCARLRRAPAALAALDGEAADLVISDLGDAGDGWDATAR